MAQDRPKGSSDEVKESLKERLQNWMKFPPKIKGWVVIGYTIILFAIVITLFFTPILHFDKDVVFTFSSVIIEIFIILLATFLGGYFALALAERNEKKIDPTQIPSLTEGGPFAMIRIMRKFRSPIIGSMLLLILISVIAIFFFYPLSVNPSYITFVSVTILEMAVVAVWFFVRVMIDVAFVLEKMVGGKR